MNTYNYTCEYCRVQYVPKRRHFQKYCSNSCRSKAYHMRQVAKGATNKTTKTRNVENTKQITQSLETVLPSKHSTEKMSLAGVGNAAAGTLVADLLKYIVQGNGGQPATKNDILAILNKLERYHPITNMSSMPFGKRPYFDLHTNELVYL